MIKDKLRHSNGILTLWVEESSGSGLLEDRLTWLGCPRWSRLLGVGGTAFLLPWWGLCSAGFTGVLGEHASRLALDKESTLDRYFCWDLPRSIQLHYNPLPWWWWSRESICLEISTGSISNCFKEPGREPDSQGVRVEMRDSYRAGDPEYQVQPQLLGILRCLGL